LRRLRIISDHSQTPIGIQGIDQSKQNHQYLIKQEILKELLLHFYRVWAKFYVSYYSNRSNIKVFLKLVC